MTTHRFEGGCHCGNLSYVFEASAPLETLGLRADMCGFCRAHGARNTSDPNGAMRIRVRDAAKLKRYRFGLKTADFLVCGRCGVYIGALLDDGGESPPTPRLRRAGERTLGRRSFSVGGWFTVNANTFRDRPALDFPAVPHDFDAEDAAGRIARRKRNWTPVVEFEVEK